MRIPFVIEVRRVESSTPPPPAPPPSVMNLYRMKPDQETFSWNKKVRSVAPNPAVNRTGEIGDPANFIRADFTKAWQFFWADLLSVRVHGKLFNHLSGTDANGIRDLFSILTRDDKFLNNKAGTNNCNNHVTGVMRAEDPKIDPLVCAGSKVKVLEIQTSQSGETAGLEMARLWTFMQGAAPPVVTQSLLDNDPRVLRATVIETDGRLTDFPQIYQRYPQLKEHWVPYPYVSKHDCWFPLRDMEKVV